MMTTHFHKCVKSVHLSGLVRPISKRRTHNDLYGEHRIILSSLYSNIFRCQSLDLIIKVSLVSADGKPSHMVARSPIVENLLQLIEQR